MRWHGGGSFAAVCANADSLDQKHETGPPATGGRGRRSSCRRKSCVNREARELRFHGSINIKNIIEYIPIVPIGTVTGVVRFFHPLFSHNRSNHQSLIIHHHHHHQSAGCEINEETSLARGYCSLNSGQCTMNLSTMGYSNLPVRDRCFTLQKLSTNTTLPAAMPNILKTNTITTIGTHVPGPLQRTKSGRTLNATYMQLKNDRSVVRMEVK